MFLGIVGLQYELVRIVIVSVSAENILWESAVHFPNKIAIINYHVGL